MARVKIRNGIKCQPYTDAARTIGINYHCLMKRIERRGLEMALAINKDGAYDYMDKKYTATQLESFFGVPSNLIYRRINGHDWSVEEAVETLPYAPRKSRRY